MQQGMEDMWKKHYGAIDGLRMAAAFGIVMMHIRANTDYPISGFVYDTVIPSFTDFVFLFMVISAFGMCCGYYERAASNQMDWTEFYGKRFRKILPFFGFLVLLDVAVSPSLPSLYEAFADLTLMFGLLQKPIAVIGVGWFLGLVFVFYLLFPFFCVLIQTKRRAWLAFAVSLIYHFVCTAYFEVGRSNILYSGCFFLAGGLIYLYREDLSKWNRWLTLGMAGCAVTLYYIADGTAVMCLAVSVTVLVYAVIRQGGGRWRTGLQGSLAVSVWRSICPTW